MFRFSVSVFCVSLTNTQKIERERERERERESLVLKINIYRKEYLVIRTSKHTIVTRKNEMMSENETIELDDTQKQRILILAIVFALVVFMYFLGCDSIYSLTKMWLNMKHKRKIGSAAAL